MIIISSSCGNDSIASIQHIHELMIAGKLEKTRVIVSYIDTGWAAPDWNERVLKVKQWVEFIGFEFAIIESMGMEELVKFKKGFPSNQHQFCTMHLKGIPFLEWIDEVDTKNEAFIVIGKRRVESKKRADTPEFIEDSEFHGGRTVWHPLYKHTDEQRDALVSRTAFKILPHRSQECSPCVNANRADFLLLSPTQIQRVNDLEVEIARSMFRPKRFNALGIHGVMTWAKYGKRKMRLDPDEIESGSGCDGHYGCGL